MVTNLPPSLRPVRDVRAIHWIKAARKDFEEFPPGARDDLLDALTADTRRSPSR
jgi:hypothetical protein